MKISKFAVAATLASVLAMTSVSPASAAHGRNTAAVAGAVGGFLLGSALFAPRGYYYGYPRYYYGYPRYYYAPGPVYYPPRAYYGRPYDPAIAYCLRRFKSYDPYSMTYLGYDGYRHPCP